MKIKMPKKAHVVDNQQKRKTSFFPLCPHFSMAKIPTSLSLFLLDDFHYCFNDFLFVKRLSKVFTKFH